MIENPVSYSWQLISGFLTLIMLILALYGFLINPRRQTNRLVSLALGFLAITSVGVVLAIQANAQNEVRFAQVLIVAAGPAVGPSLILAILALFKTKWINGQMRWLRGLLLALTLVPFALTLIDLIAGTRLYYLTNGPGIVVGGYIGPESFLQGVAGQVIFQVGLRYVKLGLMLLLVYLSYLDRTLELRLRNLAKQLLALSSISWLCEVFLEGIVPDGISIVLSSAILAFGYAYIANRQMILTRSHQAGRVQIRLTILVAAITIPLMVFASWFFLNQAEKLFLEKTDVLIAQQTISLQTAVSQVINNQITAIQNLARQPDIQSMDPARQQPVLAAMAASYPSMYLISTTDLLGMNVARSDQATLVDYSDRSWYQDIIAGAEYSLQTLGSRTTGQPTLVVAAPILDQEGQLVGLCMFTSLLSDISDQILMTDIGETGYAYIVDDQDQLVAHPDLLPGSTRLEDTRQSPPVLALREGSEPPIVFQDADGVEWLAYYQNISNGWGVIVQQHLEEISRPVQTLQGITVGITVIGVIFLLVLVTFAIRQAVRPINSLTSTVQDIASGDLSRVAPIESEDEFGTLATAFNSMTLQVRNLIESLERRVAERTLDLEHRSAQIQAAAEVGRAAANIRNLNELLPLVTRLVSERFGFYHVGIFLLDEGQEYAVLRAANSEGGQRMLARGHRFQVGQQGIVGYVSERREPRIALNVGDDAVYFSNPDLPDTQSEMALPLAVGTELLGVLDVQSTEQAAFSEQDVRTLQVLADQVAIAINSARLVQQLEQVLEAERRAYGEVSQQAWSEQVRGQAYLGYSRTQSGIIPLREIKDDRIRLTIQSGQSVIDQENPAILYVPVQVRGVIIGILKLTRAELSGSWSDEDVESMEKLTEQLGVALESARAYQTTQTSAQKDRMLAEISSRVRETLDIDLILQAASREVRQALGLSKVVIQLGSPQLSEQPHQSNGRIPVGFTDSPAGGDGNRPADDSHLDAGGSHE